MHSAVRRTQPAISLMSSESKPVRNPARAAQKAMCEHLGITKKALNKRLRKIGAKSFVQDQIRQFIKEYKDVTGSKK
jgi:hypothetical protein